MTTEVIAQTATDTYVGHIEEGPAERHAIWENRFFMSACLVLVILMVIAVFSAVLRRRKIR